MKKKTRKSNVCAWACSILLHKWSLRCRNFEHNQRYAFIRTQAHIAGARWYRQQYSIGCIHRCVSRAFVSLSRHLCALGWLCLCINAKCCLSLSANLSFYIRLIEHISWQSGEHLFACQKCLLCALSFAPYFFIQIKFQCLGYRLSCHQRKRTGNKKKKIRRRSRKTIC